MEKRIEELMRDPFALQLEGKIIKCLEILRARAIQVKIVYSVDVLQSCINDLSVTGYVRKYFLTGGSCVSTTCLLFPNPLFLSFC